jgi:hypothetical protein
VKFSQDSRSSGQDFNPGPKDYEAGMLIARPLHEKKFRMVYTAIHYSCSVAYQGSKSSVKCFCVADESSSQFWTRLSDQKCRYGVNCLGETQ